MVVRRLKEEIEKKRLKKKKAGKKEMKKVIGGLLAFVFHSHLESIPKL